MRFDERIHRFTWEAAGNPYLVETLERYFTHSLRIWYLVLDRVPGLGHAVHDQMHLLEALLDRDGARARDDHARARARVPARDPGRLQPRLSRRPRSSPRRARPARTRETPDRGRARAPRDAWRARGTPGRWSARRPPPRAGGGRASPSPAATAASAQLPGVAARRAIREQPPQQRGVDHPARKPKPSAAQARGEEARSTQAAWATGNPAPQGGHQRGERRGAGGAAARSAARRPWISTDGRRRRARGARAPHRRGGHDPPAVDRHGREGDHLVGARIEPRGLDVDQRRSGALRQRVRGRSQ